MNRINLYLLKLSLKYIFYNFLIISVFILFINIIEISRLVKTDNYNFLNYLYLTFLKLPSILNQSLPFIVIIGISFLLRNLINNNELISMRNIGFSIFDIFLPIGFSVFLFGLFFLLIVNPISTISSNKYEELINKKENNLYSIKITNNEMWIKNEIDKNSQSFINIKKMDLKDMVANDIKILIISKDNKIFIKSNYGIFENDYFILNNATFYNLDNEVFNTLDKYNFEINFTKQNILNSIENYKLIPFYKYVSHSKILQKFNLYSSEIGLFYLSEILKPIFIVMLAFVTVGMCGKFKRNESFFKVLFISILTGFLIFLFKEVINKLTITLSINFIISYILIFFLPFSLGLYQVINIEND